MHCALSLRLLYSVKVAVANHALSPIHVHLYATGQVLYYYNIIKTSIKNNAIEGWSRDGRVKKYTNKI